MAEDDPITMWVNRLSGGDQEAAKAIWDAYFTKLVGYARRKLDSIPKRSFDEEDVALSALFSFYQGVQEGRFPNLEDRTCLWNLLLTITARKAYGERRRLLTIKRGGGRQRGESAFVRGNDGDEDEQGGIADVLGHEPSPELASMFVESTSRLLESLSEPVLRQVAELKLEGYNNEEIAGKLGCVRRTVERKLERIRDEWVRQGLAGEDADAVED